MQCDTQQFDQVIMPKRTFDKTFVFLYALFSSIDRCSLSIFEDNNSLLALFLTPELCNIV